MICCIGIFISPIETEELRDVEIRKEIEKGGKRKKGKRKGRRDGGINKTRIRIKQTNRGR